MADVGDEKMKDVDDQQHQQQNGTENKDLEGKQGTESTDLQNTFLGCKKMLLEVVKSIDKAVAVAAENVEIEKEYKREIEKLKKENNDLKKENNDLQNEINILKSSSSSAEEIKKEDGEEEVNKDPENIDKMKTTSRKRKKNVSSPEKPETSKVAKTRSNRAKK